MSAPEVAVSVAADLATETFVLNHAFQLVHRAVGPFTVDLAPGLYKLKFRKGTALAEVHWEVPSGQPTLTITAPPLRAWSVDSEPSSSAQLEQAKSLSERPGVRRGQGSAIFLFVRAEGGRQRATSPITCLSLRSLTGEVLVDLTSDGTLSEESGTCGLLVHVDPGSYLLRADCSDGVFEQVVVASPDWRTQLFFTCGSPARAGASASRTLALRLEDTSVLMSRGPFDPNDPMLPLADAARVALSNQRVRMPRKLVTDLVWDKFESPMLGIYAAHALHASLERGPSTDSKVDPGQDQALLTRMLAELTKLVPGHPDVLALSSPTLDRPVAAPPMLRSSWRIMVNATLDGRWKLDPQGLSARLPASQLGNTPWLIWSERALLPTLDDGPETVRPSMSSVEQKVQQLSLGDRTSVELELNEAEEALYSFLSRRARLSRRKTRSPTAELTELGLAKALGASLPEVQQLLGTLSAKLGKHT
jgi:hypothetical protein